MKYSVAESRGIKNYTHPLRPPLSLTKEGDDHPSQIVPLLFGEEKGLGDKFRGSSVAYDFLPRRKY